MDKERYEIYVGTEKGVKLWERPVKAVELPSGWLHYELKDGTNGMAQPKNWRHES
jgi:hypothetical protein